MSRVGLLLRATWLVCAGGLIGHGFWLRGHAQIGDATVVLFWELLILGFPSAFVGYFLSFAVIAGVSMLAAEAGVAVAPWEGSTAWLLLHLVTAAFGYWQWFVWIPRLRKGR